MSVETTNTAPATAPVTNLRETRKQMAAAKQSHPAGKAAPAKAKAKADKATKPPAEKKLYTATGRSGQAVYRQFAFDAKFAIDVADPKATKALPKGGQIWAFFATEDKAKAAAAKLVAKGYDVKVTTAKAATK